LGGLCTRPELLYVETKLINHCPGNLPGQSNPFRNFINIIPELDSTLHFQFNYSINDSLISALFFLSMSFTIFVFYHSSKLAPIFPLK
jgi:hypothetical protein